MKNKLILNILLLICINNLSGCMNAQPEEYINKLSIDHYSWKNSFDEQVNLEEHICAFKHTCSLKNYPIKIDKIDTMNIIIKNAKISDTGDYHCCFYYNNEEEND